MEEILASIRRIISEDDAPPATDATAAGAHGEPAAADDVLELTQRVEPEPPPPAAEPAPPRAEAPRASAPPMPSLDALSDLDVSERPAPAPPPRPAPAASAPAQADEPLLSSHVADSAASHFGQLAQTLAMPAPGRTLEDLVRELLRPLLKDWLDQNLGKIVEQRVQAEVERLSRGRGY